MLMKFQTISCNTHNIIIKDINKRSNAFASLRQYSFCNVFRFVCFHLSLHFLQIYRFEYGNASVSQFVSIARGTVCDDKFHQKSRFQAIFYSRNTFPTSCIQRGVIKVGRKVNIVECTSGEGVIAERIVGSVYCSRKRTTKTKNKLQLAYISCPWNYQKSNIRKM